MGFGSLQLAPHASGERAGCGDATTANRRAMLLSETDYRLTA